MKALETFSVAFPNLINTHVKDPNIAFKEVGYSGATVYFQGSDAKIMASALANRRFPCSEYLEDYLRRHEVRIDNRNNYRIGPEHWDAVIGILHQGLVWDRMFRRPD